MVGLAPEIDGYVTALTDTPEIHDLYATFSGGLAFDVGANAGTVANLLALTFDKVIAVEPSPTSYEVLRRRAVDNVVTVKGAISDHEGIVELSVCEEATKRGYFTSGTALPEWGEQIGTSQVACYTLDWLADLYGPPDFVKIDVEGHEVKVMAGARDVFATQPAYLIEIHSELNGAKIASMLPGTRLVRHASHPVDSFHWRNHYWLVGGV